MATSNQDSTDQPPYPSWSKLKKAKKPLNYCEEFRRLHWPLEGEYASTISIAAADNTAIDLEPFYDASTDQWHAFADIPMTPPVKISSVTVELDELDVYERDWVDRHTYHQEFVTYGDLDDDVRPWAKEMKEEDSWEEDSDAEYLIRCCGEERPTGKQDFTLKVVPPPGHDCPTTRDYVSGK